MPMAAGAACSRRFVDEASLVSCAADGVLEKAIGRTRTVAS